MRIMVWNLENFGVTHITGANPALQPGEEPVPPRVNAAAADFSLRYIVDTVVQANPDVFVVLEVRCGQGRLGTLAKGSGPDGLLMILNRLRAQAPPATWFLVPPLRVNPNRPHTESVGVFWRSDRVIFTGPFIWPGGNGPSVAPSQGTRSAYPPLWRAAVPDPTASPAAALAATAAARCSFFRIPSGPEVTFPDASHRRPYLTTFTEAAVPGRTVGLFSLHTSPSTAPEAVARLLDSDWWRPAPNEVTVFAGDFNVDPYNDESIRNLRQPGIDLRVVPIAGLPGPNPRTRYLPRVPTHNEAGATPAEYKTSELVDFALFKYGADAHPEREPAMLVADRVMGVRPFQLPDALPIVEHHMSMPHFDIFRQVSQLLLLGVRRTGGVARFRVVGGHPHGLKQGDEVIVKGVSVTSLNGTFTVDHVPNGVEFDVNQGLLHPDVTVDDGTGVATSAAAVNEVFRRMENFGHLGRYTKEMGTSDHLPIFFIV